jgi:hypothetical protein
MPNLAATSGRSAAGLVEPQEASCSVQRIRRFKATSSFIALWGTIFIACRHRPSLSLIS